MHCVIKGDAIILLITFRRQTLLICLKTSDATSLNYQPGDHLGIYPTNPENVVNDLLEKLQASGYNLHEVVKTEFLQSKLYYSTFITVQTHIFLRRCDYALYLDVFKKASSANSLFKVSKTQKLIIIFINNN